MKAAVLPIFRSQWLWHAWSVESAQPLVKAPHWRTGRNLEERIQLLSEALKVKFQEKLMGEWTKLEQAKEGTLRNRGYKLAQAVLSREDPMETFLKSVPDPPAPLEVIAPDVFEERYVRRRLRMLAASSQRRHRSRMGLWLLALLPQVPILLTPLPAITIYYTAYRFYSHYRALKGGQALQRRFLDLDAQQIARLRAQLLDMQAGQGGLEVKPGTWVSDLLQPKHMYLDLFQRLEETQRREALERQRVDNPDPSEPGSDRENNMLIFTASKELTSILQPAERLTHPLDDQAAVAAAEYLGAPNLLQGVARARKRAVGAMFPMQLKSPEGV
ncbi:hypothetical protein ACKKBF_B34620 [Auxenochlorella protothecoides x Auxenochlorella symbiontica]